MNERIATAEAFLQEAVFRSRTRQSVPSALRAPSGDDPGGDAGNCGLGAKAAVVLDLEGRGRELFGELWPTSPDGEGLDAIRHSMAGWVRRQDGFDRKRNHFLKAFRAEHGFDRSAYSTKQLAAYERGLAEINAEVDAERRRVASELLELG